MTIGEIVESKQLMQDKEKIGDLLLSKKLYIIELSRIPEIPSDCPWRDISAKKRDFVTPRVRSHGAGPAFAAKKPAKVKGVSLTQAQEMTTAGYYEVTAKWKKVKKYTRQVRLWV